MSEELKPDPVWTKSGLHTPHDAIQELFSGMEPHEQDRLYYFLRENKPRWVKDPPIFTAKVGS